MKTTAIALVVFLAGVAATAARAESRVHVALDLNSRPDFRVSLPAYCPPAPIAFAPVPVYLPVQAPRGYWQDVTVKTWVPDRWTLSRNHWGRPVRILEPGHFAYATNRVWVENESNRWNFRR